MIRACIPQHLAKNAPREVNISHKVKVRVRASYQLHFSSGIDVSCINEEKVKALEVFQLAYEEVRTLVLNHTWSRFAKSEHFEPVRRFPEWKACLPLILAQFLQLFRKAEEVQLQRHAPTRERSFAEKLSNGKEKVSVDKPGDRLRSQRHTTVALWIDEGDDDTRTSAP
jgi:hypothetical protein